jgi:hypothetical protein
MIKKIAYLWIYDKKILERPKKTLASYTPNLYILSQVTRHKRHCNSLDLVVSSRPHILYVFLLVIVVVGLGYRI